MLGSFVPFRYASSKAANTSAARNAISGTKAAAAVLPSVSTSSNSWDSSLSSRKPQAAESPFSVCTVRRRLRAVSASPGDFSSCIASSFSFWTSSPALSKNSWRSSVMRSSVVRSLTFRSSGGTVTLSPRRAGKPYRCCDASSGIFPSGRAGFRRGRQTGTPGIQATIKLLDQPLLLSLIEIHHHVAAENDVVALRQVFGLQIVKVEVHQFLDVLLHGVAVAHFVEVA